MKTTNAICTKTTNDYKNMLNFIFDVDIYKYNTNKLIIYGFAKYIDALVCELIKNYSYDSIKCLCLPDIMVEKTYESIIIKINSVEYHFIGYLDYNKYNCNKETIFISPC